MLLHAYHVYVKINIGVKSMKIKTSKNNKKIIIISTVVVALLAISVGVFIVFQNNNKKTEDTAQDSTTITEPAELDKEQLENLEENPENKNKAPNTDEPAPITHDEETGKQRVYMVSSHNIENGIIYIRGGTNSPVAGGACSAVLTGPNGQMIEKPTEILPNSSTIDCKTVEVKQSDLEKGEWKYKLKYTSTNIEGESDEATFEIK